jgi:hypothetical protein
MSDARTHPEILPPRFRGASPGCRRADFATTDRRSEPPRGLGQYSAVLLLCVDLEVGAATVVFPGARFAGASTA